MPQSSAFQTLYRQEIIMGFDKTMSVLRDTVTTEFMDKGGSAVFLVADTIGETAVTRGINGEIPSDSLNLTQNTATLTPWHKLVKVNDFNMFASQGDLKKPMQAHTMAAINRKIDDDIISLLATATVGTGTATTGSIDLVTRADVILGNAYVPDDGNKTLLCTPAFLGYLQQTPEFSNAQYVDARPYGDDKPAFGDMRKVYRWNGMTVIKDPTLPGAGTAAEKCFLYHKNAVGHAINTAALDFRLGFNEEQLYSWANCTAYMGNVKLQNSGIVVINHDGSKYVGV